MEKFNIYGLEPNFTTRRFIAHRILILNLGSELCSSGFRGGAEGAMVPPGPVKIGHKKDGHRRRPHRFHVSRSPLTRPLDPLLLWHLLCYTNAVLTELTSALFSLQREF